MNFVWTTPIETAVMIMSREGLTAAQIAGKLGCGVTRNSVIGKLYRLRKRGESASRPAQPIAPHALAAFTPDNPPKLMDLQPHHCRWPLNDGVNTQYFFCGSPKKFGYSYCREHHKAAHVKRSLRRGGAAKNNWGRR